MQTKSRYRAGTLTLDKIIFRYKYSFLIKRLQGFVMKTSARAANLFSMNDKQICKSFVRYGSKKRKHCNFSPRGIQPCRGSHFTSSVPAYLLQCQKKVGSRFGASSASKEAKKAQNSGVVAGVKRRIKAAATKSISQIAEESGIGRKQVERIIKDCGGKS